MTLPCSHTLQTTCADKNDVLVRAKKYPRCKRPVHFVYPDCLHELICKCWQNKEWVGNNSKPPPCRQLVPFHPNCSHDLSVDCYWKQLYDKKEKTFHCQKLLNKDLPRCGHTAKVPCGRDTELTKWNGKSCLTGQITF